MKKFITFITLLAVTLAYSQTLNQLNIKYGVSKFKLESSKSLYLSDLLYKFGDNVQYYSYIKGDIKEILGYDVKDIHLGYYNNKLYYIGFVFEENFHHTDIVYNKLKNLYGPETSYDSNYKSGPLDMKWSYQWHSAKVTLSYEERSDGTITVWMISNILEKMIHESEF
ncbi:hypothetical protein EIZ47_10225 [Chryseobacterium lacus]|uniref:DUF4367 domain-containing protein n=1 Tax=Chryseobacterium lacus TaxID=2058346 RepID=A0A368MWT6_9FLAO|nr:hypothetical protein [Chryseobacterium lacus]RCU42313.1 hypothetical protein DQ356_10320 [Chryseobacterium lacus]RST26611.1 hypothetical protein EIZ47_10225 [Chryseobacterium lacus]